MQSASQLRFASLRTRPWGIISSVAIVLLIITGFIVWKVQQWQAGVWFHWDWLIPGLTGVGTLLTPFIAKPERRGLACFAAFLLLAGTIGATASAVRNLRTRLALQESVYTDLYKP